jgi:hypothetical protein
VRLAHEAKAHPLALPQPSPQVLVGVATSFRGPNPPGLIWPVKRFYHNGSAQTALLYPV